MQQTVIEWESKIANADHSDEDVILPLVLYNDEVYLNVPVERLYFFDREGYRIGPRQNWLSDFLCRG